VYKLDSFVGFIGDEDYMLKECYERVHENDIHSFDEDDHPVICGSYLWSELTDIPSPERMWILGPPFLFQTDHGLRRSSSHYSLTHAWASPYVDSFASTSGSRCK
jgi:hypothetical protein